MLSLAILDCFGRGCFGSNPIHVIELNSIIDPPKFMGKSIKEWKSNNFEI